MELPHLALPLIMCIEQIHLISEFNLPDGVAYTPLLQKGMSMHHAIMPPMIGHVDVSSCIISMQF